jgi:hypothetical protein
MQDATPKLDLTASLEMPSPIKAMDVDTDTRPKLSTDEAILEAIEKKQIKRNFTSPSSRKGAALLLEVICSVTSRQKPPGSYLGTHDDLWDALEEAYANKSYSGLLAHCEFSYV